MNKTEQVFLGKFECDFHAMKAGSQVKSLWIKTIAAEAIIQLIQKRR